MAISRGATVTPFTRTTTGTAAGGTHTVDTNTTLLVVSTMMEAGEDVSATPTWQESGSGSQDLTLVDIVGDSGSNNDVSVWTYALVNPNAGSGTLTVTHTENDNAITVAVNYLGTETTSVANAIAFLSEDDNNATITNNISLASGGASGNTLYAAGSFKGGDGTTISSLTSGFSTLYDGESGGGNANSDISAAVVDYVGGAASACAWTWNATDDNCAHYFEIKPPTPTPDTDDLVLGVSGKEPSTIVANITQPTTAALTLAEQTPTRGEKFAAPKTVALNIWKYIGLKLDGQPPSINVEAGGDQTRTPDKKAVVLSGKLPVTVVANLREPAIDELALGEQTPITVVNHVAAPGTKALTLGVVGSDPTIIHDRVAAPDKDDLVIDEKTPIRSVGRIALPDKDTLTIGVAGSEPTVIHDRVAIPDKDDLVIAEQTPIRAVNRVTSPDKDDLVLGVAGSEPTVSVGEIATPGIDELTLGVTGSEPAVVHDRVASPDKDTLTLGVVGSDPTVSVGIIREPGIDELVLGVAGNEPTTVVNHVVLPTTYALDIDEQTPIRSVGETVTPGIDELTLGVTGSEPTLKIDHAPETDTGTLVIDEQTPTIPGVVSPATRAVALGVAGSNPTVIHDRVAIPSNDALALGVVGSDPTAVVANIREPGTDALVIDEQDAGRDVTGGNPTPGTIGLTLSGKIPDLGAPVIEVPTGAINIWKYIGLKLDGFPPSLVTSHVVAPDKDTLTLSEQTPAVDIAVTVGAGSIAISEKTPVRVVSRIASPATGSLTLLGLAYLTADPSTGSLTITEQGTSLRGVMEPGTAALTIDEQTPDPDYEQSPDPTTKAVALAGKVPSAIQAHLTLPLLDTLEFDSAPPQVAPTGAQVPKTKAVTLSGKAPSAIVVATTYPATDTLTIAETTPTVDHSVYPGTASLVLFSTTLAENPITGSMALGGQPVSIFYRNGTLIENPNAATSVPSNYEICDYTGFRQMPGSLKLTWRKHAVRRKSYEERHPQERLRSTTPRHKGSRRPEREDTFIDDLYPNGVDPDDL